jgi:hypothetical protein
VERPISVSRRGLRGELLQKETAMEIFKILAVVVPVVSAVVAVVAYQRADDLYGKIGRLGDLWLDTEEGVRAPTRELIQEEVRQMLAAISAVREARGQSSRSVGEAGR